MNNANTPVDSLNMQNNKRIHFIGIGGAGMSGIAEVLIRQGYLVSGSDLNENQTTTQLSNLGATVFKGHKAENINGVDIVVVSTAINEENPEMIAARKANIKIIRRAEMLAQIMQAYRGIAVTGTHGKTTTTAMIANVLIAGDLDPTFIIGSQLNNTGCNARLGTTQYMVAEADESDATFLYLHPEIAVITNIDVDHLWAYENNFERLCEAFVEFLHHLPSKGLAILCIDDPIVRKMIPKVQRPIMTYGFSEEADIRAVDFHQRGLQSDFTVYIAKQKQEFNFSLNIPGKHNALNSLAAIAAGLHAKLSISAISAGLSDFKGTGRRFQIRGQHTFAKGSALLIDDYGHHPSEIEVTIDAVRSAWPDRRLVVAFQPHRYSRTSSLFADFVEVLSDVENLILLDVYAAGEQPIAGASGRDLWHAVTEHSGAKPMFIERHEHVAQRLPEMLKDNDILLMQGAGDIGAMAADMRVED